MKNLKKLFAGVLVSMTILVAIPTGANATWKQNGVGLWYTEGSSYSIGWRQIDSKWYYFDSNGYMKTGWAAINGSYYFFYTNGVMASNATIGGFILGADGRWMPTSQVRLENKLAEQEAINKYTSQEVYIVEDKDNIKINDDYDEDIDGITHVNRN